MADTDKEKADNLMLDMDNLMKNSGFSTYIFFCISDNKGGGFCSANVDGEPGVYLQAQILDTLQSNKELYEWLKNIIDQVKTNP